MKKILLFLVVIYFNYNQINAQRSGIEFGTGIYKLADKSYSFREAFSIAYYRNSPINCFSLDYKVGLSYRAIHFLRIDTIGTSGYKPNYISCDSYRRIESLKAFYLDIPLILRYEKGFFFIGSGMQLSFYLGRIYNRRLIWDRSNYGVVTSKEFTDSEINNIDKRYYNWGFKDNSLKLDFGLLADIGFKLSANTTLGIEYYHGFSNINPNHEDDYFANFNSFTYKDKSRMIQVKFITLFK